MGHRSARALAASVLAVLLVPSTPAAAVTVFRIRSAVDLPNGAPLVVGLGGLNRTSGIPLRLVTLGGNPASTLWTLQRLNVTGPGAPYYRIINRYSDFCMEVPYPYGDRAPVVQRPCQIPGNSHQWWSFRRPGVAGLTRYQVVHARSLKCLDITDFQYRPGTPMQQYSCSVGLNQRFFLDRLEVP